MLVQKRSRSLRLIRQHDHALASGRLAQEWIGNGPEPEPLSVEAVLGVALHDVGWTGTDERPRWDPATGGVIGFETFPAEERAVFYEEGLAFVERVHPWAALLDTLHYAGFGLTDAFRRRQQERMARLERVLFRGPHDADRARADHACLRWFDDLSLIVCLTGPLALDPPGWLDAARAANGPDRIARRIRWQDERALAMDPFPFRRDVELTIPCRDLPLHFSGAEELRLAWERAPDLRHEVRLVPENERPGRPADAPASPSEI